MKQVPLFIPLIEKEEFAAVQKALEIGWLGMGAHVDEFEKKVGEFLQAENRFPVAVSTGTAALHLSLLIAGVGPSDEVITPSFNFVADFQAILATGAQPVFCDIDEDTLSIDLDKAEQLLTSKTKAIIVLDYQCLLSDHDAIAEFAAKHSLRVIHDACHSFGSKYKGRPIGTFSDICVFSFDPVKAVTSIDGGIIMVKTEQEVKRLHQMRLVGMGQPAAVMYQNKRAAIRPYDVEQLGFRYHMSNIHAAMGLAQLLKIDQISKSRQNICRYYNKHFAEIPEVIVPKTDFEDITPFLYYIRVPSAERDSFRNHLSENGVDTGVHWQPGHEFSLFKNTRRGDLSITDRIAKEVVSLPLHSNMPQEVQDQVVEAVVSYFSLEAVNRC